MGRGEGRDGDAYADMIAFTYAGGDDTLWSLIPGQATPRHSNEFNELEAVHVDYSGNQLSGSARVLMDLDGDGLDEIASQTLQSHDDDAILLFLDGARFNDGAQLADSATSAWLHAGGQTRVGWGAGDPGSAGDVVGDGVADLLLAYATEIGAETRYCVGLFSGGVPSGDFAEMGSASPCSDTSTAIAVSAWQDDVDGDGVRDVQVETDRGWTVLPSIRLREGGVQLVADIAGPTTYWGTYFRTTADFNGDGLPEWVYSDNTWDDPNMDDEFVRTLALTGFEIPSDDPSKW